ncbi:MAG: hypothetical protein OXT69_00720 [Candidatus Poribacteria bacterium]|nr:hypothetical protein [Candidatus Poribacteria bacterium]
MVGVWTLVFVAITAMATLVLAFVQLIKNREHVQWVCAAFAKSHEKKKADRNKARKAKAEKKALKKRQKAEIKARKEAQKIDKEMFRAIEIHARNIKAYKLVCEKGKMEDQDGSVSAEEIRGNKIMATGDAIVLGKLHAEEVEARAVMLTRESGPALCLGVGVAEDGREALVVHGEGVETKVIVEFPETQEPIDYEIPFDDDIPF